MNKPNETREHYETMARAALYPELKEALTNCAAALRYAMVVMPISDPFYRKTEVTEKVARELLSRLPERDKGAG